jgi:hypothetical protein
MSHITSMTPEVKEFFQLLIHYMNDGGTWVCNGGAYSIDKRTKTFTLIDKGPDRTMRRLNAKFIPKAIGYRVVDPTAN